MFLSSFFDNYGFLIITIVVLFIMRGLLKYYLSSKIMCIIFSITTIVLICITMSDFENKIGSFGGIILYTTISTIMYSFGPEVFTENVDYQLEYHEGFFSSFITVEPHRTGGILAYLLGSVVLSFLVVNIIGYQSSAPGVFFIIPGICLITSIVSIYHYF